MAEIFNRASAAWSNMETYRTERARCKRYVFGEQWGDVIDTHAGRITEGDMLRRQGQTPLKNNILRRIIRNVVGLYRAQYKVPLLNSRDSGLNRHQLREENRRRQRWFAENGMEELAPRLLEEFLISGMVAVKTEGQRILPVTPDNFFFHSDGYDPRGRDVDLIGEIHRVSLGTLLDKFCETADDYRRIARVYGGTAGSADGCRVTEVWHRETSVYAIHHDEDSATMSVVAMGSSVFNLESSDCGQNSLNESRSHLRLKTEDSKLITKTGWRRTWYAPDGTVLRKSELLDAHHRRTSDDIY